MTTTMMMVMPVTAWCMVISWCCIDVWRTWFVRQRRWASWKLDWRQQRENAMRRVNGWSNWNNGHLSASRVARMRRVNHRTVRALRREVLGDLFTVLCGWRGSATSNLKLRSRGYARGLGLNVSVSGKTAEIITVSSRSSESFAMSRFGRPCLGPKTRPIGLILVSDRNVPFTALKSWTDQALLLNNLVRVVHTFVPLLPCSVMWYLYVKAKITAYHRRGVVYRH